jgi:hypothetical protein
MTTKQLITDYENACNSIIKAFCKKQGVEFDGWVSDEVGGIAQFNMQYFFNISDIVLDLKTRQPKGAILSWQDENIDDDINYKSYTMGLRVKDIKDA